MPTKTKQGNTRRRSSRRPQSGENAPRQTASQAEKHIGRSDYQATSRSRSSRVREKDDLRHFIHGEEDDGRPFGYRSRGETGAYPGTYSYGPPISIHEGNRSESGGREENERSQEKAVARRGSARQRSEQRRGERSSTPQPRQKKPPRETMRDRDKRGRNRPEGHGEEPARRGSGSRSRQSDEQTSAGPRRSRPERNQIRHPDEPRRLQMDVGAGGAWERKLGRKARHDQGGRGESGPPGIQFRARKAGRRTPPESEYENAVDDSSFEGRGEEPGYVREEPTDEERFTLGPELYDKETESAESHWGDDDYETARGDEEGPLIDTQPRSRDH